MKVQNITDIDAFFKVVDNCKGRVELVTGEGDRLNLKSKLSQYVSLAAVNYLKKFINICNMCYFHFKNLLSY